MPPYLLVPEPLLLEPVPELGLPIPPLLGLGLGLLLPDVPLLEGLLLEGLLLDGLLLEPEVPPLDAPEPDFIAASHS